MKKITTELKEINNVPGKKSVSWGKYCQFEILVTVRIHFFSHSNLRASTRVGIDLGEVYLFF